MYNTGDHYDHTHGTYFILLASIIITLTTQLFIYNLIHQTNISFSLPRALPLGHLGLSRRQRARACNFLRAANPAPDTEEEEELEQWRRPHRRTDGPTPPPTPPLHCCPPFFFGPSGQKAKAAAAAEEEEEARSANRGGMRRLERQGSACPCCVRTNGGQGRHTGCEEGCVTSVSF